MRRRINRKHVIPLCLQCISRSRSARKDPRRVPSTFALHPWQFRGIPRIDPISSLADRKSRKRSTSRAACRPATRRFASFQSSLATTCLFLLLLLLILSALLLTLNKFYHLLLFFSYYFYNRVVFFSTIRALSKSERARLTNKEEIFASSRFLRSKDKEGCLFNFIFTRVKQDIRRKRIYTTLSHQTLCSLFSTRTGHQPTRTQPNKQYYFTFSCGCSCARAYKLFSRRYSSY